jgi:hypothetical protein
MKFLLTTMGVLAFVLCFAQTHLSPAQLVNTAKTKGQQFEKSVLFSTDQQGSSGLTRQVGEHITLQLDEEALAQLLMKRSAAITLELPGLRSEKNLNIELVQAEPLAASFSAVLASTGRSTPVTEGMHYRGVIDGEKGSVVALSIFEGEVMGLISAPALGNLVLGQLETSRQPGQYVLYQDNEVIKALQFDCSTSDEGPDYRPEQLEAAPTNRSLDNCVNIYLEIDYDVFQDKGGANGTANYITGLFNQVATLYSNEDINVRLSEIFLWDTPSPYYGTSSYALLTQFVSERPTFNGDLGQLISYQASGGIAYLSGLCSNYSPRHSFSSINSYYANVPAYSFSVMVITHELGHLMGSRHTHACAWNGNNTAIDGCAGYVEGNCAAPGYPAAGGTIMSYCHLRSVGINFSHGFGPQPGNVVRNAVASASCLNICENGGSEPAGCEGQEVSLRIVLDQYGLETSWEIRDTSDQVVHSGGPYPSTSNGSVISEDLCLKEGCYTFEIFDEFGDGICCDFGDGYYELRDTNNLLLAEGDAFTFSESTDFCLPNISNNDDCLEIDFKEQEVISFGGVQDAGVHILSADSTEVMITGNAWKAVDLEYDITPETVIEFEFKSTREGEIHGIGFDENNSISANRTFRVFGKQNWGLGQFDNYQMGEGWTSYTIPVGTFYTGRFEKLFFVADHDRNPRNGTSFYRNIKIYEGEPCGNTATSPTILSGLPEGGHEVTTQLTVFPNPVSDLLTLDYLTPQAGQVLIQVYTTTGQLAYNRRMEVLPGHQQSTIDVASWPTGTYILKAISGREQLVKRIVVGNN